MPYSSWGGANFKASAAKTIGTEYTSVAALEGKTFAIVNKTDGKAICHKQKYAPYDLQYLDYADAFSDSNSGYTFQIVSTEGGYLVRCVNPSGSLYDSDYFQSNKLDADNPVCFIFNMNFGGTTRGLDGDGYAVWDIQYVEGNGFTLKNVGTGKYYDVPTQAAKSDTPGYFQFCEVKEEITSASITLCENFINIPQDQDGEEGVGGIHLAASVAHDGYTEYTTTTWNLSIVVKTLDVDVKDYDYILLKFASITPSGLNYSFWGGTKSEVLPAGVTEFKYIFADDAENEISGEGVIPQTCILAIYQAENKTVNLVGVYGHKKTPSTINTRTYSFDKALDFTDVGGLEAYVITAFDASTATLTLSRVYKVPANTGLYLVDKNGEFNTYNVPIIASADAITTNLLHASSGTDELAQKDGSNTNLIFGGTGADRGFHTLSAAGIMGANKAYLQIPTADYETATASSAPLRFVFEDEDATGIAEVKTVETTDNAWYTLNGVKLAGEPTEKGLYIHNGKKIVIK